MDSQLTILRITRNNILHSINDVSNQKLNEIPEGFNNNIIWNVAHNIATQQVLIYRLSNTTPCVDDDFINTFKKGTKPKKSFSGKEIEEIKPLLISTVTKLEEDVKKNIFGNYETYTTSYNITLNSTLEAIEFNNVHEALHLGYIMALKKAVLKEEL